MCHNVWSSLALWFSAGVLSFIGRTTGNLTKQLCMQLGVGQQWVFLIFPSPTQHFLRDASGGHWGGSKCHLKITGSIQPYFHMKKLRLRVGSDWLKVTQQVGSRARTGLTMWSRSCSKAVRSLPDGSELPIAFSSYPFSSSTAWRGLPSMAPTPRSEVHGAPELNIRS